jgi:hypothetical protein
MTRPPAIPGFGLVSARSRIQFEMHRSARHQPELQSRALYGSIVLSYYTISG